MKHNLSLQHWVRWLWLAAAGVGGAWWLWWGQFGTELSGGAEAFATVHFQHCMREGAIPDPELCTMRTVQLASALHGRAFADLVAERCVDAAP